MIHKEKVDFASLGRPFLANPDWAYRAARGLGVDHLEWSTLSAPYAYWLARDR